MTWYMIGLYIAEDLASKVGMTETGIGTELCSPNADTTDTTAYGIHAIKNPAQINIATCRAEGERHDTYNSVHVSEKSMYTE